MKKGLGRGLNALFDGVAAAGQAREGVENAPVPEDGQSQGIAGGVMNVDIRKVEPNPTQPRQFFDEESLQELAESMKTFGIIQPLLVKDNGGHYIIIAGERRYRAARLAKLEEVPVIVKEYTEMEVLQVALLENIQRQDLTSIEEANCYKRLMDDFFFSADDIAAKLGKNKHAVISSLHLLELAPKAQELAAEGKISTSHAKVLLSVEDPELQGECAKKIAVEGLSVRASEAMVAQMLKAAEKKEAAPTAIADEGRPEPSESATYAYRSAENKLKNMLGSQVHIKPGKKVSKIEIEYYSVSDLDRIMEIFEKLADD
ncbi:MAG: ParB/RepB/Spo0J family partition protein [Defluviitaleaceae bacterium]|nr:ParB/RepB/Spo0J family partition protein [Defluviitaleaceae bacterium]